MLKKYTRKYCILLSLCSDIIAAIFCILNQKVSLNYPFIQIFFSFEIQLTDSKKSQFLPKKTNSKPIPELPPVISTHFPFKFFGYLIPVIGLFRFVTQIYISDRQLCSPIIK